MLRQFKQILLAFYKNRTKSRQLGELNLQALNRYLSFCENERQKPMDKRQKDLEEVRSRISGTSSLSTDSYAKVRQMYSTDSLIKASLFVYFLHLVKANKIDKLNMVFKNASDLLRKYDKYFKSEERKHFLTKLITFNEELLILAAKLNNKGKIDWVYYESYLAFEEQCLLFAQIMSSFGEGLETIDNIKNNDYCNFLAAMNTQCFVVDYQKKACLELGGGQIKLFLGKKINSYCILSEREYDKASMQYRKEQRESSESKGLQDLKRYQSSKFKDDFLSEMTKLKQQYESNTARIACLFNFKDGGQEDEKWADEMRHI